MAELKHKELTSLAKSFAEAKNIRERRLHGEELCKQLGSPKERALLVSEANGCAHKLREVWQVVIGFVLSGLTRMQSKKTKLLPDDLRILKRLLDVCISANEGFENELSTGKLTTKGVRDVLKFVADLLDEVDDGTIDNPEVEMVLLELLAQICSAREIVVHFRPQNETRVILEVAERRIELDNSSNIVVAAQIVHRLLSTSVSLHISLDYLLPGFVKLVANWCRNKHELQDQTLGEMEYMMAGLAVLLNSNPEQAIAPMTRHGALILRFAKRRYRKAGIRQNYKEREALNEYFMAHIRVNQIAGRLQGLHPGDLGDLGQATLTKRHISTIFDVAVQFCTVDEIRDSYRSNKNKTDFPLNKPIQRQQLEFTARLLASFQRLVIADIEWFGTGCANNDAQHAQVPFHRFLKTIRKDLCRPGRLPKEPDVEEVVNMDAIAESPFYQYILKPLCAIASESLSFDADPVRLSVAENRPSTVSLPLLRVLGNQRVAVPESSIVPLLQIICAGAELSSW